MWIARLYVAGRFGSMTERKLSYDAKLTRHDVELRVETRLKLLQSSGVSVYPRYDLQQERIA